MQDEAEAEAIQIQIQDQDTGTGELYFEMRKAHAVIMFRF
jgi:hypothetical protein